MLRTSSGSPSRRFMLKSKIHRLTVTHADVDYEGSVTLDARLLEAADIVPFEEVHVWNVTRGTRLLTYAMVGEAGSGVVCINGAAARHNFARTRNVSPLTVRPSRLRGG